MIQFYGFGDKEELRGTASDTIEMLSNLGLAYHVKKNGSVKKYTELMEIRVWSKDELRPEIFSSVSEIIVECKTVLLDDLLIFLGDEYSIKDGSHRIKSVVQSVSRKNNGKLLKNSLTIYLF